VHGPKEAEEAARIIKRPAAYDRKTVGLDVMGGEFVGQNRQAEERIAL
jgi:hypothetical protein